jgi:DNA mismatch repair protein MSH5
MEIVQRADDLISMALQGKDLIAACSVMPRTEVQELEEAVSHTTQLLEF